MKNPNGYPGSGIGVPGDAPEMPLATPAFIGYTDKAIGPEGEILDYVPTLISSLEEFEKLYGGQAPFKFPVYLKDELIEINPLTQVEFDLNDKKYVVDRGLNPYFQLYPSLKLFFENGGTEAWIVSIGNYSIGETLKWPDLQDFHKGLDSVEAGLNPPITLLLAPDALNLDSDDGFQVGQKMLSQSGILQDRFALLDLPVDHGTDHQANANAFYSGIGNQFLSYGAAWYPALAADVVTPEDCGIRNIDDLAIGAISGEELLISEQEGSEGYNAVMQALADQANLLPCSPAIAGIICVVDRNQGLQALGGSYSLQAVKGLAVEIDSENYKSVYLNNQVWKSINPVFSNSEDVEALVSRTFAARDEVFGFIRHRLTMTFIEKGIRDFLVHFSFEGNNEKTWQKIKGKVDGFLRGLWEQGLFFGTTESNAYFTLIGLGSSMSESDLREGIMRLQIGVALDQPAEFVTTEFIQNMGMG